LQKFGLTPAFAIINDRLKQVSLPRKKGERVQRWRDFRTERTPMKTLARISLPTLAIAVALQIQSAKAIPIDHYTLTLIENSSTSLTYTYDGSGGNLAFNITTNGTDTWTGT